MFSPRKEFVMATTTDKLIAKKDGGIGWIIFNNPAKRNAMSMDMYLAMADALNDYARDPAVRVVILKGAGDKAFVSGADISAFKERRATAVPAAKLGVGYRYARLKQLEALVGPSFTMEIFYTGRQFTAQEALTMGLINRMLPVAELEDYVLNYATVSY